MKDEGGRLELNRLGTAWLLAKALAGVAICVIVIVHMSDIRFTLIMTLALVAMARGAVRATTLLLNGGFLRVDDGGLVLSSRQGSVRILWNDIESVSYEFKPSPGIFLLMRETSADAVPFAVREASDAPPDPAVLAEFLALTQSIDVFELGWWHFRRRHLARASGRPVAASGEGNTGLLGVEWRDRVVPFGDHLFLHHQYTGGGRRATRGRVRAGAFRGGAARTGRRARERPCSVTRNATRLRTRRNFRMSHPHDRFA